MTSFKDIVFATVPYTDTSAPLMAPAILKSIAIKAGLLSATVDLNIQAINIIEQSLYKNDFINFFHHGASTPAIEQELFDMFIQFANSLLKYKPKIIGLSVFTYNCQISAKYLSFVIKKISPNTKIILGGAGLTTNLVGTSKYAEYLLKKKIIDFYIRGDGENALYNYLTTGNVAVPGINSTNWQELSNQDLLALPIPDYDDYNFKNYSDETVVPILGSRGCVRNCSFCDIHAHWTKFSWRSGEHIFEEMVELNKKYNVHRFMFQDSLINGNLKEYRVLMKLVTEYNNKCDPTKKFDWSSFFILRPVGQFTEDDWRLTASGGGLRLFVGIETFNDKARFHLGKKFTNQDIEFSLQMARKYGIKLVLLFFVGYVTETEEDINFAIQWYKDHVEYKDIIDINLGTPLGILPGTPLADQFDSLGLIRTGLHDQDWSNPSTNNTPAKRVEWFLKLEKTVSELGYRQVGGADNRFILERMMQGKQ